jgi:hypothetical protein
MVARFIVFPGAQPSLSSGANIYHTGGRASIVPPATLLHAEAYSYLSLIIATVVDDLGSRDTLLGFLLKFVGRSTPSGKLHVYIYIYIPPERGCMQRIPMVLRGPLLRADTCLVPRRPPSPPPPLAPASRRKFASRSCASGQSTKMLATSEVITDSSGNEGMM